MRNSVTNFVRALGLVACTMLTVVPAATFAQGSAGSDQQASPPASKNWVKYCTTFDNGDSACKLRQLIQTHGVLVGSFELRNNTSDANRYYLSVGLPSGVLLPFNINMKIDSDSPKLLRYVYCDSTSCYAQAVVSEEFIASLKHGTKLTLTGKVNRGGSPTDFVVDFDLNGFTATFDSEGIEVNQASDQAGPADGGSGSSLEQTLQDRAEQLRQEMGVDSGGSSDASSADTPSQ